MAMTKAKRAQNDAAINDNLAYLTTFAPLYNLAITRFQWDGLPDTVDKRFLERVLVNEGEAIAFNDEDLGGLILPASSFGKRNVYGVPTGYWVWGYNGYHRFVKAEECVRILNDEAHKNSIPMIERYARLLQNLDEMFSVNVETCKRPLIIQCSEEQRRSLMDIYCGIQQNAPVIMADKNLDAKELNVFNTNAVFTGNDAIMAYNKILDRYLTWLGYENSDTEKKERLVAAQVNANNGVVEGMRNSALVPRQRAAEEMKTKLGWDVSVKFRSEMPTALNKPELMEQAASGGEMTYAHV